MVGIGRDANDIRDLLSLANPTNFNYFKMLLGIGFGDLLDKILNSGKDIVSLVLETMDPSAHASLAGDIKDSLESFFDRYGDDERVRDLVAVGYSGGFLPLAEVLVNNRYNSETQAGYNAKSLVGLGGAYFDLGELSQLLVDRAGFLIDVVEKIQTTTTEVLDQIENELAELISIAKRLTLPGIGDEIVQAAMGFLRQGLFTTGYDYIFAKTKEMVSMLVGAQPINMTQSGMSVVVNVYGAKDKLVTDYKIGDITLSGYRSEIGGYEVGDLERPLINVEIAGADHHDYIRSSADLFDGTIPGTLANLVDILTPSEDREWNVTVSAFVARLINNSQSAEDLEQFLNDNRDVASFDGQKWIIKLPGWESRT